MSKINKYTKYAHPVHESKSISSGTAPFVSVQQQQLDCEQQTVKTNMSHMRGSWRAQVNGLFSRRYKEGFVPTERGLQEQGVVPLAKRRIVPHVNSHLEQTQ